MKEKIVKAKFLLRWNYIKTVLKKELYQYYKSPVPYILYFIFLFVVSLSEYYGLMTAVNSGNIDIEFIMRRAFGIIYFMSILLAPLITMRLFSEEENLGTVELILTSPISEIELVLGKYLAGLIVYLGAIFLTMAFPLLLVIFGAKFDAGHFFAGYLGVIFIGILFVAIGLLTSTFFRSQIASAVVSFGIMLSLLILGGSFPYIPKWVNDLINFFSVREHYYPFIRGLIRLEDVVFFLSMTFVALYLAVRSVMLKRWSQDEDKNIFKTLRKVANYVIIAGLLMVIAYLFFAFFRLIPASGFGKLLFDLLSVLGIFVFVAGIALRLYVYLRSISKEKASLLANELIVVFIIIAIFGIVNYGVFKTDIKYDMTLAKTYTIGDKTKAVLLSLDKDVEIVAFFSEVDELGKAMWDFLKQYPKYSKHIKIKHVDPDRDPELLEKYEKVRKLARGSSRIRLLYFKSGKNDHVQPFFSEQYFERDVTSSIYKVIRPPKKLYFVYGHGERRLNRGGYDGLSMIKQIMSYYQFEPVPVSLIEDIKLDKDGILVFAGPRKPFVEEEIKKINNFLKDGGKALFMIDYDTETDFSKIWKDYGISFKRGYYILSQSPRSLLKGMMDFSPAKVIPHQITRNIFQRSNIGVIGPRFHLPTPLYVKENREKYNRWLLISTGKNSWAENDKDYKFDAGRDIQGPFDIVVAVEWKKANKDGKHTRIVVVGSVDALSNRWLRWFPNQVLLINIVSWLSEEKEPLKILPKTSIGRYVRLTAIQARIIAVVVIVILPFATLAYGILVWYRRR